MSRRLASAAPLVLAALSLVVAAVIYLGARRAMVLHVWADRWLAPVASGLRVALGAWRLPGWVRYSLPDALWQLSFGLVMLRVWRDAPPSRRRTFFCLAPGLLGISLEIGQGLGLVEGVFDWTDLALSAAAIAVAFLFSPPAALEPSLADEPSGSRTS
jgi:hypothetical protein